MNELTLEQRKRIAGALGYRVEQSKASGEMRSTIWRGTDEVTADYRTEEKCWRELFSWLKFDPNLALGECVPWAQRLSKEASIIFSQLIKKAICDDIGWLFDDPDWGHLILFLKPEHIFSAMDSYLITLEEAKP